MTSTSWLIKDKQGKIVGPVTYDQIIHLIERGYFNGDEKIAEYPDGKWISITKDLNLYTKLLEQLAKEPSKKDQQKNLEQAVKEEVDGASRDKKNRPVLGQDKKDTEVSNEDDIFEEDTSLKIELEAGDDWAETSQTNTNNTSTKTIEVNQTPKRKRNPNRFLGLLLILIAIALYFSLDKPKQSTSDIIRMPNLHLENKKPMTQEEISSRMNQIFNLYQRGGKSNYISARNTAIHILENQANLDAYAALCLIYRELWQFSSQTSRQLQILQFLTQESSKFEIFSPSASTCRVVVNLISGAWNDADTVINRVLSEDSSAIVYYDMKAEVLMALQKNSEAIAYLQQAYGKSPNWLKPRILEAKLRQQSGAPQNGKQILESVLNQFRDNEDAATLLAHIELFNLKNRQQANYYIRGFKKDRSDSPLWIQARGYEVLASLNYEISKPDEAVAYAQKALSLDSRLVHAKKILQEQGVNQHQLSTSGTANELIANGDRYFASKRYFEAQAEYKAAFHLDNTRAIAAIKAGEALWRLGQEKEAISWLNRAVDAEPRNLEANLSLALYYGKRYDFTSAANQMNKAQRINPRDYRVFSTYAKLELLRLNYSGAIQRAEETLKKYDADIRALKVLFEANSALEQYREAHFAISKAAELEPNNPQIQGLYGLSLSRYQSRDAGIRYLRNLINTHPSIIEYRIFLAKVLLENHRFNESISILRQIESIAKDRIEIFFLQAEAYKKLNDGPNALKALLSAAKENPSSAEVYVRIANLQFAAKQYQAALNQYLVARDLNDSYPRLNTLIGEAYLKLSNYQEALKYAQAETRRNPNLADGYLLAGDTYIAMGQYSLAAGQYQRVVQINPDSSDLYVKIARSHRLAGNIGVARSMLSVAQSKESGNPEIYKETGALMQTTGENAQAIEAYKKYLMLSPAADDRQEIQRIISSLGG